MNNQQEKEYGRPYIGMVIELDDIEAKSSKELHENVSGRIPEADDLPLAMAYVPWQKWQNLYDADDALKRGTVFKSLDLTFEGGRRR